MLMYCHKSLYNFVQSTCGTREPSHGIEHFKRVKNLALEINNNIDSPAKKDDIILISMLHDVADHKYDHDGSLIIKIKDWLCTQDGLNIQRILNCIGSVSYSKERKYGMRWFENELGPYWTKVRDIVSDADKLEALGEIGAIRCMQYAYEQGYDHCNAVIHLLENTIEKLIFIKDRFIVTDYAKNKAEKLHIELLVYNINEALKQLKH